MVEQATLNELQRAVRNARWKMMDFSVDQLHDTHKLLEDALMAVRLETYSRQKEDAHAIVGN